MAGELSLPPPKFQLDNFPKAAEFFNSALSSKYRVLCYGGAVRGGKTFTSLGTLIMLHKIFPGTRSVIVRDTGATLRINTLPSLEKVLPESFVRKAIKSPSYTWTFTNDSFMFFMGENIAQDPELLRWNGLEVNFILLEQAEELDERTFEKALERAGSYVVPGGHDTPAPIIIITVNPNAGWVKRVIYDRWENGTLPENWLYLPALMTDNPFIPDTYKQSLLELEHVNPIKYRKYVLGDWNAVEMTGSEAYKGFAMQRHVVNHKYDPALPLHITFDFNVAPYMTLNVFQYVINEDGTKDLRQVDEICGEGANANTRAVCQMFASKYARHMNGVYIYGDPSGNQEDTRSEQGHNDYSIIMEELAKYRPQTRVLTSAPSVMKRIEFVNAIWTENFGGISFTIDQDCTNSINDYLYVKQNADGTKVKERKRNRQTGVTAEKYGHTSDANEYLICYLFADDYDRFRLGSDPGTPLIGPNSGNSDWTY